MKKFLSYSVVAIVCVGCFDVGPVAPKTEVVDLGAPSRIMNVVSTSGPVVAENFTITVNVTPEATYNLQLTHINGEVLHSYGFTANASQMSITLNYKDIVNGAYDLNLMDNTGRLLKVPVIVQH